MASSPSTMSMSSTESSSAMSLSSPPSKVSTISSTASTHTSKQPYQFSKNELGGFRLNELFPKFTEFKLEHITAKDLTQNEPKDFVYRVWERTVKVKITLIKIADDGYAFGKMEWENAIYEGVIKKFIIKSFDKTHETIIPHSGSHECKITYKDSDKRYEGFLMSKLIRESNIMTFLGVKKTGGKIFKGEDSYFDDIGFDFATGNVYPCGQGKFLGKKFTVEGTFFHLPDPQGTQKDLQLYASGKLTSGDNRYKGVVKFVSSGYTLVLPNEDYTFEKGIFENNPLDCKHESCSTVHYETVSTARIISKKFSDEEYFFGVEAITKTYDTENLLEIRNSDFLIDPCSLKVFLPTEELVLEYPNISYFGSFALENFHPLGEGMIVLKENDNSYCGPVTFSPNGVPKISSIDNKEYQTLINEKLVKVKIGKGLVITSEGTADKPFYFDNESNIYPIPKDSLDKIKLPPISPKKEAVTSPTKRAEQFKQIKASLPPKSIPSNPKNGLKPSKTDEEKGSPILSSTPLVRRVESSNGRKLVFQPRQPFSFPDLTLIDS